ncbi:MAG TPA: hypothetical protein VJ771_03710 [Candidatus Nitrosotalea sp.]|nr:hypothetical protein [Candidatus Nitrosotalea sp.]
MHKLKVIAGIGMIIVGSILSVPMYNLTVLYTFIPTCQSDYSKALTQGECSANYSNWLLFRLICLGLGIIGIPILISGLKEKPLAPFSRK